MPRVANTLKWQVAASVANGKASRFAAPRTATTLAERLRASLDRKRQAETLAGVDDRDPLEFLPRNLREIRRAEMKLDRWQENPYCGQCCRLLPQPRGFALMSHNRIICVECRTANELKRNAAKRAEKQRIRDALLHQRESVLRPATACHDCGRSVLFGGPYRNRPQIALRGGTDVAVCWACLRAGEREAESVGRGANR
jgi:RNase P subunit RPR2